MGNTSKKLAAKCTILTREEQKSVAATFRAASKSERIREEDLIVSGKLDAVSLEKFWGPLIDPRLAQYLSNFLFWSADGGKAPSVDFNRFAQLYVYNVRGTVEEKLEVIYTSLGKNYNEEVELPYQLLKEYCESIASTYIKILKTSSPRRAALWIGKGFRGRAAHVQALGEALAASVEAADNPQSVCTWNQLNKWLQQNILLQQLTECVFINLYGINKRQGDESPVLIPHPSIGPSLLPAPEGLEAMPDYPAFTDLSHIVWLNNHIPQKQQNKWRFLFSSHIHGESFSTMAGRIQDQGSSVMILEDSSGFIFGGYAPDSWSFGPNFVGNEDSFLFTLSPKMRVYPATGYNNHYQYMNHHTKTLPNGLLMGGQFNFGGIFINAEPFGDGSSAESCTTYRAYKRLSKEPTFRIRSLEFWAVGDKPVVDKDLLASVVASHSTVLETFESELKFLEVAGAKIASQGLREEKLVQDPGLDERDVSVLDVNPEAKAILDMAGRTRHSEGLRDPAPL